MEQDNVHRDDSNQPLFDGVFGTHSVRTRRERLTTQQKLTMMVDTLRRVGWAFDKFLEAWVGVEEHQRDVRIAHLRYGRCTQRREILTPAVSRFTDIGILAETSFISVVGSELDRLIAAAPFNAFSFAVKPDDLDYTEAVRATKESAPSRYQLMRQLLVNRRSNRLSYHVSKDDTVNKRLVSVTSIVCLSRTRQMSNTVHTILDLYLQGSGVPRRVIEALQGLGLCHSYRAGLDRIKQLEQHAKVRTAVYSEIL